jgi:hypothetical protein
MVGVPVFSLCVGIRLKDRINPDGTSVFLNGFAFTYSCQLHYEFLGCSSGSAPRPETMKGIFTGVEIQGRFWIGMEWAPELILAAAFLAHHLPSRQRGFDPFEKCFWAAHVEDNPIAISA